MKNLSIFLCSLVLALPLWANDESDESQGEVYYGLIIGASAEVPDDLFSVMGDGGPTREGFLPLNNELGLNSFQWLVGVRPKESSGRVRPRLQTGVDVFHYGLGNPKYTRFDLPPESAFHGDVNDHVSMDGRTWGWRGKVGLCLDVGDGHRDVYGCFSGGPLLVRSSYDAEILGHGASASDFDWTHAFSAELGLLLDETYRLGWEIEWYGPVDILSDQGGNVALEGTYSHEFNVGILWRRSRD